MVSVNFCRCEMCRFKDTHVANDHICGICGVTGHGQLEHNKGEKYITEFIELTLNDELKEDKWCKISGCTKKKKHITSSHICFCGKRHENEKCPDKPESCIKCPLCRKESIIKNQNKIVGIDIDCCVCQINKVEIYLPECGHVCLCINCKNKIEKINVDNNINTHIVTKKGKDKMGNKNGKIYTVINAGMGCYWLVRRNNIEEDPVIRMVHSDDFYDKIATNGHEIFKFGYKYVDEFEDID